MASPNLFSEVGSKLFSRVFSGVLWFGIGLLILGILAFLGWYFGVYKRKFDIRTMIKSGRAEDKYSILEDWSAILFDRQTKTYYFRVWKLKRDFVVPKYDLMQKTNKGDLVEMYRVSENEFYFLRPPKIDMKRIYTMDGKLHAEARQTQSVVDPEMGFWAAKRKTTNKKMFDTESILMKLLPFLPHIITGVISIFILYILLDHLPGILSELKELTQALSQMQRADIVTG